MPANQTPPDRSAVSLSAVAPRQGDGGPRSSVPWDCDVIRMWGNFYVIPGNQALWSFSVSHNAVCLPMVPRGIVCFCHW